MFGWLRRLWGQVEAETARDSRQVTSDAVRREYETAYINYQAAQAEADESRRLEDNRTSVDEDLEDRCVDTAEKAARLKAILKVAAWRWREIGGVTFALQEPEVPVVPETPEEARPPESDLPLLPEEGE